MKPLYLLPTLLLSVTAALAQSPECDNLIINDIHYNAFNQDQILIECTNLNIDEIFDYPGFIITDQNGNDMAVEEVTYFGIAGEHVALLDEVPGTPTTIGNFVGGLMLWTGFYDILYCTLGANESLCPVNACTDFDLSIVNFGGALTVGTFTYLLAPDNGDPTISGLITLDAENQSQTVNLCLPNANYTLSITTNDFPLMGQPNVSIAETGPFNMPQLSTSIDNATGSAIFPVPVYVECIFETGVPIGSTPKPAFTAVATASGLMVSTSAQTAILTVYDAMGRSIATQSIQGQTMEIPLPAGLYIVELVTAQGSKSTQKVVVAN